LKVLCYDAVDSNPVFAIIGNMKKGLNKLSYTVVFAAAEEGGYTATVPALPGCISEGDTFEQAKKNIAEAIGLYLEVTKPKDRASGLADFVIAPVSVSA